MPETLNLWDRVDIICQTQRRILMHLREMAMWLIRQTLAPKEFVIMQGADMDGRKPAGARGDYKDVDDYDF